VALVHAELGDKADALVPLINGGVVLAKLQGVMHDTCNVANAIARRVKALRNDSGKALYGVKEWHAMEGYRVCVTLFRTLTRSVISLSRRWDCALGFRHSTLSTFAERHCLAG
jgi:hypothetical protein